VSDIVTASTWSGSDPSSSSTTVTTPPWLWRVENSFLTVDEGDEVAEGDTEDEGDRTPRPKPRRRSYSI